MRILQKCVRKEIELDKYSTKIKHLNRGKLHLNQKGWKVLGVAFLKEIFNIFNWYYINENSRLNHEGCKSNFSLENDKRIEAKTILKLLRRENTNKFVHRNKFELFVNQSWGKHRCSYVLMVREWLVKWRYLVIWLGRYSIKFTLGGNKTDWRFLCRDKSE